MERATTDRRTRHQRWRALALVAVVLAAAACSNGDDDDGPQRRSTTTPSTAETTTTLSPEQEVEAAYLAFAEMGARLLRAPDPDDPEIAQRTTGEARGNLVDGLTTLRAAGERFDLGPSYGHDVLSVVVTGDTATTEVCVVEDSRRVDAVTGEVLAEGLTAVNWSVNLALEGDRWLVTRVVEGQVHEGATACA